MGTVEKIFNLILEHPVPFTLLLIILWYLMTDDSKKLIVIVRFLMVVAIYIALLLSYPQYTDYIQNLLVDLGLREYLYNSAEKTYQWFNAMVSTFSACFAAAVALIITFKERKLRKRKKPAYEIKKIGESSENKN